LSLNIIIITINIIRVFQAARPIKLHTQTHKEEQTATCKNQQLQKKENNTKQIKKHSIKPLKPVTSL